MIWFLVSTNILGHYGPIRLSVIIEVFGYVLSGMVATGHMWPSST